MSLRNNGTLTITGSGEITSSRSSTVRNAGTLTKAGKSKITNTANSSSGYSAIYNTGIATINAGTITGEYAAIDNNGTVQ